MLKKIIHKLRSILPHAHWVCKYLFFYLRKGRFKNAVNFLFATFATKEEGIVTLFEPLYRKNWRLVPLPRRIEVEPTTRCALRCVKCEQKYWKEERRNMSFHDFKRIVDMFPPLRAISTTGIGHGFENPDYMQMLAYCKKKALYTQLFDTFLLMNAARAEEVVRLGVDRIMLSMDGATRDTYERHQVGSKFDRVVGNLRHLLDVKERQGSLVPEIAFVYVVMKDNLHEMSLFLELLHEIFRNRQPVIWVQFIRLIVFEENEQYDALQEDYDREVAKTEALARRLGGFRLTMVHCDPQARPSARMCTAWTVPFITVEGDVYPCCTFTEGNIREVMRHNCLGNVFETDFRTLWNSATYRDFRSCFSEGRVPRICREYSKCSLFDLEAK